MSENRSISQIDREKIAPYLDMLQGLSESTDDYLTFWEVQEDRVWFFGNVAERFNVMQDGSPYCTLEEWEQYVYYKDLPALKEDFARIMRGESTEHNMEYRVLDRQGNLVWISCRSRMKTDMGYSTPVMVGRVSYMALRYKVDELTGMFNLTKFKEDALSGACGAEDGALLLLDVDNLKHINLSQGRGYGDEVLKHLAGLLESESEAGKAYRMEKGNFAVCMPYADADMVRNLYRKVQSKLPEGVEVSGGAASTADIRERDYERMLLNAEYALDRAKEMGKNRLEFFREEDYEKELVSIELGYELAESVKNDCAGFYLVYQPQIRTGTYRLFGAEALLRFTSPSRGFVGPDDFVPILEQSGLIRKVGLWVLKTALEQCRRWRAKMPDFHISVNLAPTQLLQEDIMERVLDTLRDSGLPGKALTLELTESQQLQNLRYYNRIFEAWRAAGINIAVDDFGTGYSSLGYLKNLKIDEIKIDKCFISGIHKNSYNYRLLYTVIELVAGTQIRVCCEGIEEKEELQVLEELKPELLQGYLFSKPREADEFEKMYFEQDTQVYQEYRKHIGQVQKKHFRKLMQLRHYDILKEINLGLWMIHIDVPTGEPEMYADETMLQLLGTDADMTPEECYKFWYSRIKEDCREYVEAAVVRCIAKGNAIQVQYIWQHPQYGDVEVYCAATCVERDKDLICLEGYHRMLTNIEVSYFDKCSNL